MEPRMPEGHAMETVTEPKLPTKPSAAWMLLFGPTEVNRALWSGSMTITEAWEAFEPPSRLFVSDESGV